MVQRTDSAATAGAPQPWPGEVAARKPRSLEQCAGAFFDAAWPGVAVQLATDPRLKSDLLKRQGPGAALASVSGAVTLAPDGDRIIVDKLRDTTVAGQDTGSIRLITSLRSGVERDLT
ncbi:DUF5937 family protein [Streptomyces sp. NPDC053429]|uniref:DUF5937 family protein n=1 Tax=Streptomyces sp. NPDC053429 TaxID=3365702 RepID=UPI0037D7C36D